tara:strand:+ start:44 stop:328 length:285 start_codon:yes stop_codon:yes gene_type:complete
MNTASKKTEMQCVIHDVRRSISDLGRSGLTFDWGKMKPNQEYFISRDNILSMDMLWFLSKRKIQERAKELNSDVLMFEDIIKDGWVIRLCQYCA